MGQEVKLVNLTHPEVVEILERNPMVVLPAGSVEQHGRHLPSTCRLPEPSRSHHKPIWHSSGKSVRA